MDTGQKTESLAQLVDDIDRGSVALPEFQRDFVWDIEKTFDLFDSFVKDIFVGSLIYGSPSFEITVRELDDRPRTGKGSRRRLKLTSFTKAEIEAKVKTTSFRLLLDGQQRATSIYRALRGIDKVYFVVRRDDALDESTLSLPASKRPLEAVLSEFSGDPIDGHVCIDLKDVYSVLRGENSRESEKLKLFLSTTNIAHFTPENAAASEEFEVYLTQLKNLENLFRQEKLVAYYLLDTNEEKFALFFERSNSKGLQLNFIDILAAKLYSGFNLRQQFEAFAESNPAISVNKEVVVRFISFVVSGGKDTGRTFILSTLNHAHFTEYWQQATKLYALGYEYLRVNRLLIHSDWIPYDNLLMPLMIFLRQVPHNDFAQINADQAKALRTWYWLTILGRRYSSAAQSYVREDAQALEKVGRGEVGAIVPLFKRSHVLAADFDALTVVWKKYDAMYKGILNLVNYHCNGFRSLQSGDVVGWDLNNLEDHHIFPRDYLSKTLDRSETDVSALIDCVVNRTLIPKLTNIRASNKMPSKYLSEIQVRNPDLQEALNSHLIPEGLIEGIYDDSYQDFLQDRAKQILAAIDKHVTQPRDELIRFYSASPD